jgi:hypothetical protein
MAKLTGCSLVLRCLFHGCNLEVEVSWRKFSVGGTEEERFFRVERSFTSVVFSFLILLWRYKLLRLHIDRRRHRMSEFESACFYINP